MATKRKRAIGTTLESVTQAENEVGQVLPPSFRNWLLESNGLNLEGVHIFPMLDERDIAGTWDSIVRRYDDGQWFPEYFALEGFSPHQLLPFASLDSGDYFCFDYSRPRQDGEVPVVWWSHETADYENRAESFAEFVEKVKKGKVHD